MRNHRLSFRSGELERKRVKGDQIFCARDRVRETFLLPSSGSLGKKNFFTTRSRSSYERAGWSGDFRFVFAFRFRFLVFVYQAKIIQYCFYHKPLKNSTVLHLPLSRRINTAGALKDPKLKQYRTFHYT